MTKLLVLFLLVGAFAACNNDKMRNNQDKDSKDSYDDRDKNKDDREASDRDDRDTKTTNYGWTRSEEDQFMGDCESTARQNVSAERAREYCDCMMKKIEKIYSTLDEANRKMTQADMQPLADECNGVK